MSTQTPPADPWRVELVVVAGGHTAGERRAISRDGERGLLTRIGPGSWARAHELAALTPEGLHVVRLRALAAASRTPVVFSHWSAAVLHGLPALRPRLVQPHATVQDDGLRHRVGVTEHCFELAEREVVLVHGLQVTGLGRTIVDLAGAAPLEEGAIAADAALAAGVPRAILESAIDLAGPRRAHRRIRTAIDFAHPGGESPAETRTRVTAFRIGVAVPELQHRMRLAHGRAAFLDIWFPAARAALEVDGDAKYLDPAMARDGAGAAVVAEKRREDEVRLQCAGFARIGWAQSGQVAHLRPVLGAIGVHPLRSRPPLTEWVAAAREARPRRPPPLLG